MISDAAGVLFAHCVPTAQASQLAPCHLARWLIDKAYYDNRGILTWPRVGREGHRPATQTHPRQGWCHGTPGVAWTLYELSEALRTTGTDDISAHAGQLSLSAMRSLCQHYNEDFHLGTDLIDGALAVLLTTTVSPRSRLPMIGLR